MHCFNAEQEANLEANLFSFVSSSAARWCEYIFAVMRLNDEYLLMKLSKVVSFTYLRS